MKDPRNPPSQLPCAFAAHTQNPMRIAVAALQQAVEVLGREERGGNHGSLGGAFHELASIMLPAAPRDKGFRRKNRS